MDCGQSLRLGKKHRLGIKRSGYKKNKLQFQVFALSILASLFLKSAFYILVHAVQFKSAKGSSMITDRDQIEQALTM